MISGNEILDEWCFGKMIFWENGFQEYVISGNEILGKWYDSILRKWNFGKWIFGKMG